MFKSKISLVKILYYQEIESYAKSYTLENAQSKARLLDRKIIVKMKVEQIFETWCNIPPPPPILEKKRKKFSLRSKIMNCCPALENT